MSLDVSFHGTTVSRGATMAARLQQFEPRFCGMHQLNQTLAGVALNFL